MKGFLLVAGFGTALYLFLSKKNFSNSANFSFEKMQIDLAHKKIFVTLGVANPTGQSLNINSIVGNLIMNNSTIAAIESFTKTIIAPNAKSMIKLQLIPSAMGLFAQAKLYAQSILQKKNPKDKKAKKTITATFKGAANLEGLTIPIDINLLS